MATVKGSKKQKNRAQEYLDAAEGMTGMKNKQAQVDFQKKAPPRDEDAGNAGMSERVSCS